MAEIDLEELKRLAAAQNTATFKWEYEKLTSELARRVLELAAERDAEIERTNLLANEIQALWDDAEKLAAEVERLRECANINITERAQQQLRAEAAEATLREIDSHLLEWAHDPSLDWPRNQISRILKLARPE